MAGTVLTPSGTTGFNRQVWMDTIEAPTYQEELFGPTIRKFPGKILNTANIRKSARALGTTLAQNAEGTGLTASDITGTPITITPVGRYIDVEWSANEKAQVDVDLSAGDTPANIEKGMAETHDVAGLALVATLTQTMSQAAIDAAMWRQAVGRLIQNTNGQYGPSQGPTIRVILTPTQYPAVMGIEEFVRADARGDSENPNVRGFFTKAGGVNAMFSTAVTQDANGWHCPVYVTDAFIWGENQSTNAFEEQTELKFRVVVYSNRGYSVLHDLRAIDLRLTASQL